jgi:hypothetical protein
LYGRPIRKASEPGLGGFRSKLGAPLEGEIVDVVAR